MPGMRYAARLRVRSAKYDATSFLVAPILRRDRTIRSMLTEESAASIFATLDWLEPRSRPSCCWVIPRRPLCSFIARPSPIFTSTMAASSSFKPKNSEAFPIFHPADFKFFSFRVSIFERTLAWRVGRYAEGTEEAMSNLICRASRMLDRGKIPAYIE